MSNHPARMTYEEFAKLMPKANTALIGLSKAAKETGLDPELIELVKIRVSQMNGCAFCTSLHLDVARRLGVDARKLDLVATWRDAQIFSPREAAALDWAECLTDLTRAGARDALHLVLQAHFQDEEIVALTLEIGVINNWNRIGVGLRFPPVLHKREAA